MVAGASSSARVHGVDRFYNPPALRRQLQMNKMKLQEQQEQPPPPSQKPPPRPQVAAADSHAESDDSSSKPSVSSSSSSSSSSSPSPRPPALAGNLNRFLDSTTPTVPAQYFCKPRVKRWRSCEGVESCPYFNLGDLWESFSEWSAYGAGVPLVLNGSDSVVQYYVPYLSAIQIFLDSSGPILRSRQPDEESDGDICQDTSSEGTEDEADQNLRQRSGCLVGQEGFLSDDAEVCNQVEQAIFEYFERDSPYGRVPLADKISSLAGKFPDLKTYKSCDLLPASWISVAWYPIYRIPVGPTLQDLDACFLTFHSLATPFRGMSKGHPEAYITATSTDLRLPIFGLASYKLNSSIWISNSINEPQQVNSLRQAAENWLLLRKYLIEVGDEVLLFDPAYETYETSISLAGGVPVDFVRALIQKAGVAAVPGCRFFHIDTDGESYQKKYIRFAFCKSEMTLVAAAQKMQDLVDSEGPLQLE
ncbi:hypothetical protein J5N97_014015 [Dioscorea zingiberensis]|uniref:Aminotransferase class I/classII domain-containing protein n=1 Tax=Dioscorea zingiberensis TaxID=325984 RepID=A0A9D5HJA8_9LILI|nr:hypothetical protein J5N97_014015 [Dioscorea zingiberensis]